MTEFCKTCGKENSRIDAAFVAGEQQFTDSYCGWCGVKWGSYVEWIREANQPKRKRRLVKQPHGFSRFGS
jgi:hypothetical protein